jgi:tRNA (Thr-GGU) A37 N-methylase
MHKNPEGRDNQAREHNPHRCQGQVEILKELAPGSRELNSRALIVILLVHDRSRTLLPSALYSWAPAFQQSRLYQNSSNDVVLEVMYF